jgi:hypothetical protein
MVQANPFGQRTPCMFSICSPTLFYFLHFDVSLLLQRADVAALSRDHGLDITAAAMLSALHSFFCFDHELDNTVNAGVDSPAFAAIFQKVLPLFTPFETRRTFIAL